MNFRFHLCQLGEVEEEESERGAGKRNKEREGFRRILEGRIITVRRNEREHLPPFVLKRLLVQYEDLSDIGSSARD